MSSSFSWVSKLNAQRKLEETQKVLPTSQHLRHCLSLGYVVKDELESSLFGQVYAHRQGSWLWFPLLSAWINNKTKTKKKFYNTVFIRIIRWCTASRVPLRIMLNHPWAPALPALWLALILQSHQGWSEHVNVSSGAFSALRATMNSTSVDHPEKKSKIISNLCLVSLHNTKTNTRASPKKIADIAMTHTDLCGILWHLLLRSHLEKN